LGQSTHEEMACKGVFVSVMQMELDTM
jgi:hypothetical protein